MHPVLIHRQQGKKENNIHREKQSDEERIRLLMGVVTGVLPSETGVLRLAHTRVEFGSWILLPGAPHPQPRGWGGKLPFLAWLA